MNLYLEMKNNRLDNLKNLLETPIYYTSSDYSINIYEKETFDILVENINYLEKEKNKLISFLRECSYLGTNDFLKDKSYIEYMKANCYYMQYYMSICKEDLFFTNGDEYIDFNFENVYIFKNKTLVNKGKVKDLILKYELEWFDSIYIRNINLKQMKKRFEQIKNKKITKFKYSEFLEFVKKEFQDSLIDIECINAEILSSTDELEIIDYVKNYCTTENYNLFLEGKF